MNSSTRIPIHPRFQQDNQKPINFAANINPKIFKNVVPEQQAEEKNWSDVDDIDDSFNVYDNDVNVTSKVSKDQPKKLYDWVVIFMVIVVVVLIIIIVWMVLSNNNDEKVPEKMIAPQFMRPPYHMQQPPYMQQMPPPQIPSQQMPPQQAPPQQMPSQQAPPQQDRPSKQELDNVMMSLKQKNANNEKLSLEEYTVDDQKIKDSNDENPSDDSDEFNNSE